MNVMFYVTQLQPKSITFDKWRQPQNNTFQRNKTLDSQRIVFDSSTQVSNENKMRILLF